MNILNNLDNSTWQLSFIAFDTPPKDCVCIQYFYHFDLLLLVCSAAIVFVCSFSLCLHLVCVRYLLPTRRIKMIYFRSSLAIKTWPNKYSFWAIWQFLSITRKPSWRKGKRATAVRVWRPLAKKSTANLQLMVNSNRGRITYGLRIAGYFRV